MVGVGRKKGGRRWGWGGRRMRNVGGWGGGRGAAGGEVGGRGQEKGDSWGVVVAGGGMKGSCT